MERKCSFNFFAPVLAGMALGAILTSPGARAAVNVGSSPWVWQNPLPQGNGLKATTCFLGGTDLTCLAVGDLGTILFGDASGGGSMSWFSQNSGTTQTLRAITCPTGNNCFAVGDSGTILATTNLGVTWTSQSSGITASLSGVSCQTAARCFAIGGGWILATSDGGLHWYGQPHPGGTGPSAISCPDVNTCFVTANNSGANAVVLKTTNGGATWPATSTSDLNFLTAISCGSTSNCVVVDIEGNSIATSDGGKSWGPLSPMVMGIQHPDLYGVSCRDALNCVAVGAAGGSGNNLYQTNNGGSTWYSEASGAPNTAILRGVSCPAGTCVTVGDFGVVTTNYPIDFVYMSLKTSVTDKQLRKVSCANANDCYAVGDGGIFATTNGGATWVNQFSSYGLLGIHCPTAAACFAVGANLILATTNGGMTWTSQTLGTSAVLAGVNCPSATTCFAAGTSILSTADGGKTWVTEAVFSSSPGVFAIGCMSTTNCVAVGYAGGIFTRSGNKWSQVPPSTAGSLQDVSCPTAASCVAVGDNGATISTHDGGKTWLLQPSTTTKNLSSVGCLAGGSTCYAGTWDGYILSLGYAGWTQEAQVEPLLDGVSCAGLSTDYRCVAVGDPGTIVSKLYVYSNGGGGGGGHCGTPSNPCPQ